MLQLGLHVGVCSGHVSKLDLEDISRTGTGNCRSLEIPGGLMRMKTGLISWNVYNSVGYRSKHLLVAFACDLDALSLRYRADAKFM